MSASSNKKPFRLTIIHPCVGRRTGDRDYIKTWQMEPVPAAMIAAMAPNDVEIRFYDDRLEPIPFDEPTDAVAMSVETYTACRAYQIASQYRSRGVPVLMGGFHATLCPEEVQHFCDALVIGEGEGVFARMIDDLRLGKLCPRYQNEGCPSLDVSPDRSIFKGKRYLPLHLVEFSRGCPHCCDFCAIQAFYHSTSHTRPIERVLKELAELAPSKKLIFFIDDNFMGDAAAAHALMQAMVPMKLRWVTQMSIRHVFNDTTLDLMRRSGCKGVLIGFESLDSACLQGMHKGFNQGADFQRQAVRRLHQYGIRVYGTFLFGCDQEPADAFEQALDFALGEGLFIAAFNHVTPFPGTQLYHRLEVEGRLLFQRWWLDARYRYNMVPFRPLTWSPEELARRCVETRRRFYGWGGIAARAWRRIHLRDPRMWWAFILINAMHRRDTEGRNGMPLGDAGMPFPDWSEDMQVVENPIPESNRTGLAGMGITMGYRSSQAGG
jgi:radical SAM superfamily enzyme YgiQ (UPF0313 family)